MTEPFDILQNVAQQNGTLPWFPENNSTHIIDAVPSHPNTSVAIREFYGVNYPIAKYNEVNLVIRQDEENSHQTFIVDGRGDWSQYFQEGDPEPLIYFRLKQNDQIVPLEIIDGREQKFMTIRHVLYLLMESEELIDLRYAEIKKRYPNFTRQRLRFWRRSLIEAQQSEETETKVAHVVDEMKSLALRTEFLEFIQRTIDVLNIKTRRYNTTLNLPVVMADFMNVVGVDFQNKISRLIKSAMEQNPNRESYFLERILGLNYHINSLLTWLSYAKAFKKWRSKTIYHWMRIQYINARSSFAPELQLAADEIFEINKES